MHQCPMPEHTLRPPGAGCDAIPALLGHTIATTGHRRSDELTGHLRSFGATVLPGAMVHTRPLVDDPDRLRAATAAVIAEPPHYLVATTGIGLRGWFNVAASWGLRAELLAALRHTRVLARGPKVVGALSEAGLDTWHTEPSGRTTALVERLATEDLRGTHVALQLPGAGRPDVIARLAAAGVGRTTEVEVYEWTWPDDLVPPRRLLRAVVEGRVSAVTFTSGPAVRNFAALAAEDGIADDVGRALRHDVLAVCIGAATAEELDARLGAPSVTPAVPVLGELAQLVATEVRRTRHHHVRTAKGDDVVVQGCVVDGGRKAATMSDREAALLHRLLARPRSTIGRDELLRAVWRGEAVDPSVLETTMARLRRRLAGTGITILTITSRGYLLGGEVMPCPGPRDDDPMPGLIEVG